MMNISEEIIDEIREILRHKSELDRAPRHFGTELLLYNAEIQLIETIGNYPHSSLTSLAEKLKQTKGAVSQTLKRLSVKGCVIKEVDPSNRSGLLISLSKRGDEVLNSHQIYHNIQDSLLASYLNGLDKSEIQLITQFLDKLSHFIDG